MLPQTAEVRLLSVGNNADFLITDSLQPLEELEEDDDPEEELLEEDPEGGRKQKPDLILLIDFGISLITRNSKLETRNRF